jgi:hypothetical protein
MSAGSLVKKNCWNPGTTSGVYDEYGCHGMVAGCVFAGDSFGLVVALETIYCS